MHRPALPLRALALLALPAGLAAPALAEPSLSIPLGADAEITAAQYSCETGAQFPVQYVNAEPIHLALMQIDGQDRIFVNVMSGSGARYVAGEYEWWTKGDTATLRNLMQDDDGLTCTSGS